MRSLSQIIDSVHAGEEPTYDELFYAVSALHHLISHDGYDLVKTVEAGNEAGRVLLDEHCKRLRGALQRTPRIWLGDANDPRNPEFQERRLEVEASRRRILH